MDCDQVFMILTRGPFPTGELWDEEVEAHLEVCAECWQLAEALRPALEVFQEAVPPAESRDLPGYWGDARPAGAIAAALRPSPEGTTTNLLPACRTFVTHRQPSLASRISPEVLRAMLVGSAMTATAVGIVLLWWAW